MHQFSRLLLALLLAALPGLALAGTVPAPALQHGVFVYTIPANYDPPMIGRHGLQQLQARAKQLHYPFYVVIVKDLPGSTDEDAANAVNGLAEDWSSNPRYDVGRSSIFFLSMNPRKFRLLAGATWKDKLNLQQDALQPYTSLFVTSVQGTPKDPKTGILNLMTALDADIFDQIDPAHVAARAKVEKQQKQEEARQQRQQEHDQAIIQLQAEVEQAPNVLSPSKDLPADTHEYFNALNNAKQVLAEQRQDTAKVTQAAQQLQRASDNLGQVIQQRRMTRQQRESAEQFREIVFVLLCLSMVFLLGWRQVVYLRRRRDFTATARDWSVKIANAKLNYERFFEERRQTPLPSDLTGETQATLDAIVAEAGKVYGAITAMEAHLQRYTELASGASYMNLVPLKTAQRQLTQEFQAEAAALPLSDLYAAPGASITVNPLQMMGDLAQRFAATVAQWEEVKTALTDSQTPAEQLFSTSRLEALLADADAHGIPRQWLGDHPLFGDAAADARVYAQINADRDHDPVAYEHKLAALRLAEEQVAQRLARLIAAKAQVDAAHLPALPAYGLTVAPAVADPALTFAQAQQEEQCFNAALQAAAAVDTVEAGAGRVVQLYQRCTEQAAALRAAIAGAEAALQQANATERRATEAGNRADLRLTQAQAIHAHTELARSQLQEGQAALREGHQLYESGRTLLVEQRHLDAYQTAGEAAARCTHAYSAFVGCVGYCDELDAQRAAYERQLIRLADQREQAEHRMRQFGRASRRLPDLPGVDPFTPVDYAAELLLLTTVESTIANEVQSAFQDYQSSQSSFGSSDSSSGGGFSSSDSSSGGSFDSGSSGGDSSSGGSW